MILLSKIVRRKTPIDQFVENSVDVISAAILVIQVVGVFPIAGTDYLKLVAIQHEPRPATAKLSRWPQLPTPSYMHPRCRRKPRSFSSILLVAHHRPSASGYASKMCGSMFALHY